MVQDEPVPASLSWLAWDRAVEWEHLDVPRQKWWASTAGCRCSGSVCTRSLSLHTETICMASSAEFTSGAGLGQDCARMYWGPMNIVGLPRGGKGENWVTLPTLIPLLGSLSRSSTITHAIIVGWVEASAPSSAPPTNSIPTTDGGAGVMPQPATGHRGVRVFQHVIVVVPTWY